MALGIGIAYSVGTQAHPVETRGPAIPEYSRGEFSGWIDADKDCQDTRNEVLIEESLIPVVLDKKGCVVLSGMWHDPYTGKIFYDPKKLDIDHMVPLREAWYSGAYKWSKEQRVEYANYLNDKDHLIAVSKSANRSKGAKDPSAWMPPNLAYWQEYMFVWGKIKKEWELEIDLDENKSIRLGYYLGDNNQRGIKIRNVDRMDELYVLLK